MKFCAALFLLIYFSLSLSSANEKISVPYGAGINVDGGFSAGEWDDSGKLDINLASGSKIKVYFKHDMQKLYIAFCGNLMAGYNIRCPEILLDINNDKSNAWSSDDWWFHVSATDCYSKGIYGDYSTCKPIQSDWEANNLTDATFNDTVEIIIPFSTIGIENYGKKNIGISFIGTDTQTIWEYWPSGANKFMPSSWAEAEIDFSGNGTPEDIPGENAFFFPNPSSGMVTVTDIENISGISVFSITGEKIFSASGSSCYDLSRLQDGVYLVRWESPSRHCSFNMLQIIK